jgi:parvulin-like peptidyl-prolyl isomerase
MYAALAGLFLAGLSPTACRQEQTKAKSPAEEPFSAGAAARGGALVLAKIGDEEITAAHLKGAMESTSGGRLDKKKYQILDAFIQNRVFGEEARRVGLEKDPKVQEEIQQATKEVLARYFVKKYIEKEATPSEEEVRNAYKENKETFVIPERVMLQHIVVQDEQQAQDLLKQLQSGNSFESLAEKHSICRCRRDGGNHGWIAKNKLYPDMAKIAFGAKLGQPQVIETKAGFEVFKIIDRKGEETQDFEQVKAGIQRKLYVERKSLLVKRYQADAGVDKAPANEDILAVVGDKAIPVDAIRDILAETSEKNKEKVRGRWVDYFIDLEVYSNEAKKVGLDKDPEVSNELRRQQDGVLADAYRRRFVADDLMVSPKDIAAYYQSHAELFTMPEKIRCKSILVDSKEDAEAVLQDLKDGAVFASLAVKRSLYPKAARRGGEIGWFSRGEKDPALEEVAFSLKKGEVSDIIKTEQGYEIVKLMDRKEAGLKPLEEVRNYIDISLREKKKEEVKEKYYKKARVQFMEWSKPPSDYDKGIPHAFPGSPQQYHGDGKRKGGASYGMPPAK